MKFKKKYKELIIKTKEKSNENKLLNIINNENDKYYFFNKERTLSVIKLKYKCNANRDYIKLLSDT